MKYDLRPNVLTVCLAGVGMVLVLAFGTNVSDEVISGLGGTMLGIIGTSAKELINPSKAE